MNKRNYWLKNIQFFRFSSSFLSFIILSFSFDYRPVAMSTSVEVRHLCGKARRLSLNSLQTPALLFQTSGGFQPYLSNGTDSFPGYYAVV